MKRLQYPNKNYLIKRAIAEFDYSSFGLVGFRKFNLKNPEEKQVYAIKQRILESNYSLRNPTLLILCYLTKERKGLDIKDSVIKAVEKDVFNIKLITETQLD